MKRMILLLCVAFIQTSHAQQFRLTVASSIAGNTPGLKDSLFVVRADECPAPAKATITAAGEGLVAGVRRSVPINLIALSQPDAYAVSRRGMTEGTWVVALTAMCKEMTAGAIVPIGPQGFTRETSRFFPRPATPAEINEALRLLTANGGTK